MLLTPKMITNSKKSRKAEITVWSLILGAIVAALLLFVLIPLLTKGVIDPLGVAKSCAKGTIDKTKDLAAKLKICGAEDDSSGGSEGGTQGGNGGGEAVNFPGMNIDGSCNVVDLGPDKKYCIVLYKPEGAPSGELDVQVKAHPAPVTIDEITRFYLNVPKIMPKSKLRITITGEQGKKAQVSVKPLDILGFKPLILAEERGTAYVTCSGYDMEATYISSDTPLGPPYAGEKNDFGIFETNLCNDQVKCFGDGSISYCSGDFGRFQFTCGDITKNSFQINSCNILS